jgi:uncharacterized protein
MSIQIGKQYKAIVLRKTDIGYMLSINNEEVFLHFKETKPLLDNDEIDVFIYIDSYDRMAATTHIPTISLTHSGLVEVMDVHPSLGVFVNVGMNKHVLLSSDDLPYDKYIWPMKGDHVFVKLEARKKIVAKISDPVVSKEEVTIPARYEGFVIKWMHAGIRVLLDSNHVVFIHISQLKEDKPRLGQRVEVYVTFKSDKGFSGTLLPFKEIKRLEDADIILAYLKRHHSMPLDSNSDPVSIEKQFSMSKKAFKRAIGHLYKLRKIKFENNQTIYIGE